MVDHWAKQLVHGWSNQIAWTNAEIEKLSDNIVNICISNNGYIHTDQKIPQEIADQYCINQVEEVLTSYVSEIVRRYFKQTLPKYAIESNQYEVVLDFIRPTKLTPRIDINRANKQELEKLPSIGPKTAERIIEYREKIGGIRSVYQLWKIKGLSKKKVKNFINKVYIRKDERVVFDTEGVSELIKNPTFNNYIAILERNNILISKYSKKPSTIKQIIIEEIEGLLHELNERKLHDNLLGVRSSEITLQTKKEKAIIQYENENSDKNLHGVLLTDTEYPYFILRLLEQASTSIRLIMFFFRFEEEGSYPTDPHMNALISAKQRGVDVKVILDRQEEDDPRPSRAVNAEAYAFLNQHGIPVIFDSEEIATHSKVLVVDNEHVVVGSHNWTAGSFYIYRDNSFYFYSKKIAGIFQKRFDMLFNL